MFARSILALARSPSAASSWALRSSTIFCLSATSASLSALFLVTAANSALFAARSSYIVVSSVLALSHAYFWSLKSSTFSPNSALISLSWLTKSFLFCYCALNLSKISSFWPFKSSANLFKSLILALISPILPWALAKADWICCNFI